MLSFPAAALPSTLQGGHNFAQVPKADIQRSQFNRSCGVKTAFNSGYLIPVFYDLALPGDSMNLKMSSFARLSTLTLPVMDNVYLASFFFAVPIRLIWANFKKFCGEQATTSASTNFTIPVFSAYAPAAESLSDYLGIPISGTGTPLGNGGTLQHISLFHRAYNLIWNEWFRDQNLQDSVTVDTGDGPDSISDYVLLKRGKRHDYFTSCLPWTQKNNTGTAVSAGLSGNAPITGLFIQDNVTAVNQAGTWIDSKGASNTGFPGVTSSGSYMMMKILNNGVTSTSNYPQVFADLSSATGITINALRLAFQTQKMYERDARGGTRYREIIQSHFGVLDPNDARLQRPEYLGGGVSQIYITPVPQTSVTSGSNATGRLSATGVHMQKGQGFVKSFSEHCIILGLVCAYADLSYQAGLIS